MNSKQKLNRQTKVQFFCKQIEERRQRLNIKKIKPYYHLTQTQMSQRIGRSRRLEISQNKFGNTSCCCSECGRDSQFKQRIFKIYPFNGTSYQYQESIKQNQILDRYRNSKYIKTFRKLVYCLLFIIRYRIVQNIRFRQRQRMKKVLKTRVEQPRMTFLNVLDIAKKSLNPKFKSASNFDFAISQNATALNSPQDSDEEFYHLKPKKSLAHKLSTEEHLPHKKLSKSQQKVYLITGLNSVLNQYVTSKLNKPTIKCNQQSICMPPLLSLTVSPRQNQSTHLPHIRIRHNN
ncbi:unnamed protein product (macronuclear) [Paramecium tetraurelia]|uniref:Transmembrane protein n=1 Tax=Paramecium tetraurelia TaxID=5888 RepID=A0DCS3_PARTE|nr:uncharacterized protein GSPATT00015699001 [Paramecium tetraurelia]CAK80840.1 unnamed protein product [Paramecium tetraurelia]|eukprot:XP_001448237.1 hypothetical protein (macronuclear) [Paramecium tetraurelia strain d4-2]